MTRGLRLLAAGVGIMLAAAACTPIETIPPLTPQQIAARTDEQIPRLDPLAGRHAAGDFSSTWVAYFDATDLLLIEERGSSGDYGNGQHRFYFHGGNLIYYTEDSIRRLVSGFQPVEQRISIRASLSPNGSVIEGSKLVNGVPQPLDPFEIQQARNHGIQLQAQARSARGVR